MRVTYVARADLGGGEPPPSETPPEIANAVPAAPAGKVDTEPLTIVPGATVAPPVAAPTLPVPAVASTALPAADTQPSGEVQHVPVPAATHMYVQAGNSNANRLEGSFAAAGDLDKANRQRRSAAYRVRIGPFE